jgi:hypothetical protein
MNTTYVRLFASVIALLASAPFLGIGRFLFERGHPTFFQSSIRIINGLLAEMRGILTS